MNQKILGILPLIIAVIFIAAFVAGSSEVAAASGSSSAGQTVTLIVRSSAQNSTSGNNSNIVNPYGDIALSITPTGILMSTDGSINPLAVDTAYSGTSLSSDTINMKNVGTVPINLFIRSASTQFSDGNSNVFTPTAFTIISQAGSHVNILTVNSYIANNMPKKGSGSNFNTHLTLNIPFNTPAGNDYQNSLTYTAIKYT